MGMNPHICVVYLFYLTLSLSQWKIFFLYHSHVCTWGQGAFFSFWKCTYKNNKGACHRPHIMAGRRFPSVLLPCLCLLPRPAHALFICWFVCWCCVVTQNTGATLPNLPPPPPRIIYLIIVKLYIYMKSYDYRLGRGSSTSSRQMSLEFLLVKNCPWTKNKIWFRLVVLWRIQIKSLILSRDKFWTKGIQKKFGGNWWLNPGPYCIWFHIHPLLS